MDKENRKEIERAIVSTAAKYLLHVNLFMMLKRIDLASLFLISE